MFEQTSSRSPWRPILAVMAVVSVLAVGLWAGVDRLEVLISGGNPLASPTAGERHEQIYPDSPLAVALALEGAAVDLDGDAVLAWADDLARDVGTWLLAETGASDVHAAEVALWHANRFDALATRFAVSLQDRTVVSRKNVPLVTAVPESGAFVVHPDLLPLLMAHVAWRLDLNATLVRSPEHLYVLARDPDGSGARTVEATCFRRVDALGALVPSEEPSVGRRLVAGEAHYPGGSGGVRNPDPLPVGAYETVSADALAGDLVAQLVARRGAGVADALEAHLGVGPAPAQAVYHLRLSQGVAAWEAGDAPEALASHAEALEQLRAARPDVLPARREELVVVAASTFEAGGDGWGALRTALADYDAGGPVEQVTSDAHGMALWLALRRGKVDHAEWNARIIPLMNRHRGDPVLFGELCRFGERALRNVEETLDELMPECAG